MAVDVAADSPPISFASLTLGDPSGTFLPTLQVASDMQSSGSLTIHGGSTLRHHTTQQFTVGSVMLHSGGRITHTANTTTRQYVVNIKTLNDFTMESGAEILLDYVGYQATAGPGASSRGSRSPPR